MILSFVLALSLLTAPTPKKAVVIDTHNDIISVNVKGDIYAFKGDGYHTGDSIFVIMDGAEIKGVL